MRRTSTATVLSGVGAALLVLGVTSAAADTVYVATNGVDTFFCGAKDSPCRSIGLAILIAAPKDTIQVGPGLYGDLNYNGSLEGVSSPFSGEEFERDGCDCMILVDKQVTIVSEKGAAVTLLDAGGAVLDVVRITAAEVVFGKKGKGFTITGLAGATPPSGVRTVATTSGVRVAGNRVIVTNQASMASPIGYAIDGTGHRIEDNVASGSSDGPLTGTGFALGDGGSDQKVRRNVATFVSNGFLTPGQPGLELLDNVAIANFTGIGIGIVGGGPVTVQGNSILANSGGGLTLVGTDIQMSKNNVFGNWHPLAGNCGLNNASGSTITASKDFWGSAGGPGPDPADEPCATSGGGTTVVDRPASKPYPIKATAGR